MEFQEFSVARNSRNSVFRGIIFLSEIANPNGKPKVSTRALTCEIASLNLGTKLDEFLHTVHVFQLREAFRTINNKDIYVGNKAYGRSRAKILQDVFSGIVCSQYRSPVPKLYMVSMCSLAETPQFHRLNY